MKATISLAGVGLLASALLLADGNPVHAEVYYVDLNGTNAMPPYTNWVTAATNIQDAVDVAIMSGALVLVTNGTYTTGSRVLDGATNRVVIARPLEVRSVNGPQFTAIDGANLFRCAYLTNGASLNGFTLTNGFSADDKGGVYGGTLNNCILVGNSYYAAYSCALNRCTLTRNNAGAWSCTLTNCTLSSNYYGAESSTLNNCNLAANSYGADSSVLNNCAITGSLGYGAEGCTLNNCTLTGNAVVYGSGVYSCALSNCIIYFNNGWNYDSSSTLNYCCTTPLPTNGVGNITSDPQLASSWHISAGSPCRGAGNAAYARGTDIDGETWANPPSIGCDEYHAGALTGPLNVAITASFTNVTPGFAVQLAGLIEGKAGYNVWDFGDGVTVTNEPYTSHAWGSAGDYAVVLRAYNESQPGGVSATLIVHILLAPIHYVAVGSTNPVAPYASWATAATNIQDAVDAATVPGALVLVTNGTYSSIVVGMDKFLNLQSVSGPQFTMINGGGSNGCVYLYNVTTLSGFTVTNGHASFAGGVYSASAATVVSNCVLSGNLAGNAGGAYNCTLNNCALIGNSASDYYNAGANGSGNGGGATYCTLNNCTLIGNSAYNYYYAGGYGGGAYYCTLSNCAMRGNSAEYGGGAYSSTLNNCSLTNNSASREGGGACYCTLTACALAGNSASDAGGAAYQSTLNSCVLARNSATNSGGGAFQCALNNCTLNGNTAAYAGGVDLSTLTNCTLKGNSAQYDGGGVHSSTLTNCSLTDNSVFGYGGGAYQSALTDCMLIGNAAGYGGGVYQSTLYSCALAHNSATNSGGGTYYGTLNNCTLTGNSALNSGGGASGGTLNNCIVYFNTAPQGANYDSVGSLNYCCTTPLPVGGANNISLAPQLASLSHLSAGSPCRGAGSTNYASGTDIDGEAWLNPPSIGCDEYLAGAAMGQLSVGITASLTNVVIGFAVQFTAQIDGKLSGSVWDFGDGITATNQPVASHAWNALGDYTVILRAYNDSHPDGVTATAIVHVIVPPVHYVAAGSASPLAPYTSWATAARNIQDGVDAVTVPGAVVLVTNGIYSSGGRVVYGTLTNRVAVTRPLTLRSVNGPQFTIIQGRHAPGTNNGDGAIRCVYLTNGASLFGFTLTNGATRAVYDYPYREGSGGGLWCESTNDVAVSNCVLTGNSAYYLGGGVFSGTLNNCILSSNSVSTIGGAASSCTLNNCTLTGNSATNYGSGGGAYDCALNGCFMSCNSAYAGGGAIYSTLNNCTLTGNSALNSVGGAEGSALNNCIVYFNTALYVANYDSSCTLQYCCTTPQPTNGIGNISVDPQLATFSHIGASSPCRGAGSAAYASGTDIDGEAWLNPPSIGCDEYHAGAVTGSLNVAIVASFTNVSVGFTVQFTGLTDGKPVASFWDFGDGITATNRPYISHAWASPGDYAVVLRAYNESQPGGVSANVTVHVVNEVHYVSADSAGPVAPYTSWATAARNIQDAVDAAIAPGSLVLVTNGIYADGGRPANGTMTNRVAVMKQLVLRSVNGPHFTVIQGHQVPGTTNGDGAIRCVYLTNGASLFGFTLTNGATRTVYEEANGGGLWCESIDAVVVSNCVVTGNSAYYNGGGAYGGTLSNCKLLGNSSTYSSGGGAYGSALNKCLLSGGQAVVGGGASSSTLDSCALTGNSALNTGGATFNCSLTNCSLGQNSAGYGGGASDSTLDNCTVTGNSAQGGAGGGAWGGTLSHCTLSGNSAGQGGAVYSSTLYNSALTGNTALEGGGADYGTLNNCTLTGNSAVSGGGAARSSLANCIVYFNSAPMGANYDTNCTLNYCCTTPQPAIGVGNLSLNPQLASASHISPGSPCRGAGNPMYASGIDIDGEPWLNPPSIGCDEYHTGAVARPLSLSIAASFTNVATDFMVQFTGSIDGPTMTSIWDFGDGTTATNQPYTAHTWTLPGDYLVVLRAYNESQPGGISASVTIHIVHAVHYVAADSANPIAPYTSWATAATNIQDAVDVATVQGALVLVTNGTYATGGRAIAGDSTTNRVAADKTLSLQSVNGPQFTVIVGGPSVRCVLLTNSASLSGFTLTGGTSGVSGSTVSNCTLNGNFGYAADHSTLNNCTLATNGAGAYFSTLNNCALIGNHSSGAYSCTLSNCTLAGNLGDGADYCTLNNCILEGNSGYGAVSSTLNSCAVSANFYNGASQCTLTNCTLTANSRYYGVGASSSTLNNCIVYFNGGANYDSYCALNYCCTTPQPTNGVGNISTDPQLVSLSHLLAGSPCSGAGNGAYVNGTDIDGEAWLNPPSIGCDEYHAGALTGPLSAAIIASYTNVLIGYAVQFTALIGGRLAASSWDFGDGTTTTNQPLTSHAWTALGAYPVVLRAFNDSYPGGISATVTVHVVTGLHYVIANTTNPVPPYTSWATAARSIQDAINAAEPGASVVVVSNGTYGPINVPALMTVRSVNGPQWTTIDGSGRSRCASLATNATLSGFTLSNGFASGSGGGAIGGTLTNCTLTGNMAEAPLNYGSICIYYDRVYHFCRGFATGYSVGDAYGGGAAYCNLIDCTLAGNVVEAPLLYNPNAYQQVYSSYSLGSAYGGGAAFCALNNCTLKDNLAQEEPLRDSSYDFIDNRRGYGRVVEGGGAYNCTLTNCMLNNNRVQGYSGYIEYDPYDPYNSDYVYVPALGSGTLDCTLANCTLTANQGDSAYSSTLLNCALTGNAGAGAINSKLNNCTLTGNYSGAYNSTLTNCIVYFNGGANYDSYSTLYHCCTTPLPTNGVENISSDPQLASASHLSPFSPCIGKGDYAAVSGMDIDGELWANPPSIGCDEYHAGAVTGPLSVDITTSFTNVAVGYSVDFTALIEGRTDLSAWTFGDGGLELNRSYTSHSWSVPGDYVVSLWAFNDSYPGGVSSAVTIHVVTGIHYAAANSPNPVAPYASWAAAATNIQDAINAVEPGGSVVVSNGTYGPIHASGALPVRSVNGALFTIINGASSNLCVSLASGGILSGFTLTNGAGGASGGTLNNCVIVNNSGSGGQNCTLNSCLLTGNSGIGASGCTLNNCTLTGNSGTGASGCRLNNCVIYFNSGTNYDSGSTLNYCCTIPQPANGAGNLSSDPQLASASHLSADSPCRGAGSAAYVNGTDIDGEAWANPPSIGCDEYHTDAVTGTLNVSMAASFTNVTVGFLVNFTALIEGRTAASAWDFGDGITVTNQPYTSHAWAAPGDFAVVLRAFNESQLRSVSATLTIHVVTEVHYVAVSSTNPVAPYTSWTTAATNIQDALDAAIVPGAQVVVSNGTYTPIRALGSLSVRSVNGPQFTIIDGGHSNWCATLGSNGAILSGFTLTNGGSAYYYGGASGGTLNDCILSGNSGWQGAGAYYSTLNNCVLRGNSAFSEGGGAYYSTLNNCSLIGNSAGGGYGTGQGGGASYSTLSNCTLTGNSGRYGGGTFESTLNNCVLTSNSVSQTTDGGFGGGAYGCTLNRCMLNDNSAIEGGGAIYSTLNNCSLTGNMAPGPNAGGGGAGGCILNNCTLLGNSSTYGGGASGSTLNNCIVLDATAGCTQNHCWTTDPLFAANLRLQSDSPCINAGDNTYAVGSTDLDGNPRIAGGAVDIGAYEFQSPISMISYAWLQQYSLPISNSTDSADPDGDAVDNYHEWLAGTDPTNPLSSPAQLAIIPSETNIILMWSTNAVGFNLQSTTNVGSPTAWVTNSPAPVIIGGQNAVTDPITGERRFYRLIH